MVSGKKIVKNSVILITSQIVSKFINLGLILVLTRMLGSGGYGLYSFSFAYAGLFVVIIHLGINNLLIREVAKFKDRADEFIGVSLPLVLILSCIALLILNSIPLLAGWLYEERVITLVFGFYFVFDTLGRYFLSVARAFERMEYEGILNIIERFLLIIIASLTWIFDSTLLLLVSLFTFVMFCKATVSLILVRKKFVRFDLRWQSDYALEIVKDAYPFALVGLFAAISARGDLLLLKFFHSTEVVGIYSAARKIIDSLTLISENIHFAVFPAISVFYLNQKIKFNQTFQHTLHFMILIAIPVSVGLFILAPKIITFLFDPEFQSAYIALRWLSIALGLIFVRHAFTLVLNAVGRQHFFAIIFGISMAVNLLLNFILIPHYQILGASLAAIAAELVILIISLPILIKYVNPDFGWIKFIKTVITVILLYALINAIQDWSFLLIILISTLSYVALLLGLRLYSIEDLKKVRELLSLKILGKNS